MKLSLSFAAALLALGCSKPSTSSSSSPSASDAHLTSATVEPTKDAVLEWRVLPSSNARVVVTLQVDGVPYALGPLDATTDDVATSGTPAACSVRRDDPSRPTSTLTCGGTPAFNFLTADLKDGAIVVTKTTGVQEGATPTEVKKVELRRVPSPAATLAVRPFASGPAKKGAAKANANAKAACAANEQSIEGECRRECRSKADCNGGQECTPVHDFSGGKLGPLLGTFCE